MCTKVHELESRGWYLALLLGSCPPCLVRQAPPIPQPGAGRWALGSLSSLSQHWDHKRVAMFWGSFLQGRQAFYWLSHLSTRSTKHLLISNCWLCKVIRFCSCLFPLPLLYFFHTVPSTFISYIGSRFHIGGRHVWLHWSLLKHSFHAVETSHGNGLLLHEYPACKHGTSYCGMLLWF